MKKFFREHKWLCAFIGGIIVVVIGGALLARAMLQPPAEEPQAAPAASYGVKNVPPERGTTQQPPVTLKISAAGDCTLGSDVQFSYAGSFNAAYEQAGNPAVFLSGVRDVFAGDDLTIVNMEGTLTQSTARQDKLFAFKGDASYANILKAGSVEAATLANNHSHDYGEQSYQDTFNALQNVGLTPFGYDRSQIVKVKGIPVALVGIYDLDGNGESSLLAELAKVKEQQPALIIVYFHWEAELETQPESRAIYLAHLAIDNGADLVLGAHPHVVQGIETYKGRKICYSLGNFCFGGNSNPSDKDTFIFQQEFRFENGKLVAAGDANIIPCSISSHAGYNDYRPRVLTGSEGERVRAKIAQRSAGLDTNP